MGTNFIDHANVNWLIYNELCACVKSDPSARINDDMAYSQLVTYVKAYKAWGRPSTVGKEMAHMASSVPVLPAPLKRWVLSLRVVEDERGEPQLQSAEGLRLAPQDRWVRLVYDQCQANHKVSAKSVFKKVCCLHGAARCACLLRRG